MKLFVLLIGTKIINLKPPSPEIKIALKLLQPKNDPTRIKQTSKSSPPPTVMEQQSSYQSTSTNPGGKRRVGRSVSITMSSYSSDEEMSITNETSYQIIHTTFWTDCFKASRTFCSQLNFPKSLPPIAGGRGGGEKFMSCAVCGSACESLKFDTHKIPSGI